MTKVTMMGNPIEVKGHFPQKGEKVENVHFTNKDLADVLILVYVQRLYEYLINEQPH